jgi:hypothetical protein
VAAPSVAKRKMTVPTQAQKGRAILDQYRAVRAAAPTASVTNSRRFN